MARINSFKCPHCGKMVIGQIVDSRPIPYGRWRRRLCEACSRRFTTIEKPKEEKKHGKRSG